METHDVTIIGAGVVGNAIARELSKTTLSVLVVEKEADVAFGTSARNSGVVHSGIHYAPGSLRARFAVQGNRMMEELCNQLYVAYKRIGKLTVAYNEDEVAHLHTLKIQGERNGVEGLRILNHADMELKQPGIAGHQALFSPSTGIINPIAFTIALGEHAHANGVEYKFLSEVITISQDLEGFYEISLKTPSGNKTLRTRLIINCAGLHADSIARMTGYEEFKVYPCRGEYYVLDKRLDKQLSILIYPVPGTHSGGLGIHLTSTTEGNILIGPNNEYIEDPQDFSSTTNIMEQLKAEGQMILPSLQTSDFIRSFAGIRPKLNPPSVGGFHEFVIHQQPVHPHVIHLLGIESPGLTASPAIAQHVFELVRDLIPVQMKAEWAPSFKQQEDIYRQPYPLAYYSDDRRQTLLQKDPDFGALLCRCEEISKAEVRSAIKRIFGPITLVGIKQRCRTMTGRCQGGFCLPRIISLLEQEFGYTPDTLMYKGPQSPLFSGYLRGDGGPANA
jgi:glycerol-3-phosphate dehydrogenase